MEIQKVRDGLIAQAVEDISERAIDVQINRLRRKIETDPRDPLYLQTVRGTGYVLRVDQKNVV